MNGDIMKSKNEMLNLLKNTKELYKCYLNNIIIIENIIADKINFRFQIVYLGDDFYLNAWSTLNEYISIYSVIEFLKTNNSMGFSDYIGLLNKKKESK